MKFCRNCGKLLEDKQSYCSFCGKIAGGEREIEVPSYEEPVKTGPLAEELEKSPFIQSKDSIVPLSTEQPLSNWIKVILSVLIAAIPGAGALIGLITGIIYMNKKDKDRQTFGQALLTFSIIFLLLFCSCVFIFYFTVQEIIKEFPYSFY
ncbi:MAG: zinc ribbon domain-containing protein [Epulopiscium sp.]|nr:zinc ribbon domain-containing protein [Candidatus Epulonipiscium sp.]